MSIKLVLTDEKVEPTRPFDDQLVLLTSWLILRFTISSARDEVRVRLGVPCLVVGTLCMQAYLKHGICLLPFAVILDMKFS